MRGADSAERCGVHLWCEGEGTIHSAVSKLQLSIISIHVADRQAEWKKCSKNVRIVLNRLPDLFYAIVLLAGGEGTVHRTLGGAKLSMYSLKIFNELQFAQRGARVRNGLQYAEGGLDEGTTGDFFWVSVLNLNQIWYIYHPYFKITVIFKMCLHRWTEFCAYCFNDAQKAEFRSLSPFNSRWEFEVVILSFSPAIEC